MYSYILPAHKNKIVFITAGESNLWHPTFEDLEMLRHFVDEHNLSTEQISKLLIVTCVQEFSKIESNEEYIFIFSSYNEFTYLEKQNLQEILNESINDDTMKVFMGPHLKVKRLKKSLLPFI